LNLIAPFVKSRVYRYRGINNRRLSTIAPDRELYGGWFGFILLARNANAPALAGSARSSIERDVF